ncbi:MAG: O-antigen ligase family protein [Melioribacteraceae bacterium]|nr:O-antigen ligase family protein [Melioribacteraceae bacterium]
MVYLFFILAVLTHSLYVIYDGFTSGRRTFGILGVYYIDYAGLGSLLSFILLLYSKGLKKISYSILFFIISLGLIITQTRNAWLSTAFAIFTLIIYLFINSKKVFIKRYILGLLALLVVGLLIINLTSSGVDVSQRIDVESQSVTLTEDPESIGTNSFVSRIMIWHTAIVAFGEHPFIGIGAYAFKHTSQFYYKIPKGFHKLWVEGRTPHITFLQVLTETGIVGFVAFLFFIFVLIKLLLKTVKLPKTREEYIITIMTVWSLVYILFSMMMTESWLYGPYIIWFGILLGLLVNLFKLLSPPSQY